MPSDDRLSGLRIALVSPWRALPCDAAESSLEISERAEQRLLAELRARSAETVGVVPAVSGSCQVIDAFENEWRFEAIDRVSPSQGRSLRSASLIEAVRHFDPDIVIMRGTLTLTERLLSNGAHALVTKLSGVPRNQLILSDFILAESARQISFLRRRGGPPSMIIPKALHPAFQRKPSDATRRDFDAVVIGRLVPVKNLDLLQPVVDDGYRLAIVGSGPESDRLQHRWAANANVTFFGEMPPGKVREVLDRSSALIHLGFPEGLPRAIVEALAAGRPVIGLRGTIDAALIDRSTGELVRPWQLSEALGRLCSHEDPEGLSQAARQRYEERFSSTAFSAAVDRFADWLADWHESGRELRRRRWGPRARSRALGSLEQSRRLWPVRTLRRLMAPTRTRRLVPLGQASHRRFH